MKRSLIFCIQDNYETEYKKRNFLQINERAVKMPRAKVNGITLHYIEEGKEKEKKSPIILIHGLTSDAFMYEKEIEALKKDYRVIALDSRGHGRSDKPATYTLDDHIQDVISLMDELNIERAHILGTSMGSYIAQGVAIHAPERVDKLILVVAKAHGQTSSMARLFKVYESEVAGMTFDEKSEHVTQYIYYDVEAVKKSRKAVEDKSVQLTNHEQVTASKALEQFDFRDELDQVQAETLVISGKHDELNPPEYGEEIAELIPDATFVQYEYSGHSPSVEQPTRYIETVCGFLK